MRATDVGRESVIDGGKETARGGGMETVRDGGMETDGGIETVRGGGMETVIPFIKREVCKSCFECVYIQGVGEFCVM